MQGQSIIDNDKILRGLKMNKKNTDNLYRFFVTFSILICVFILPYISAVRSKLVDGDLQKSMPMWKLSETINKQSDRILELRLEGDYSGTERNVLDYLNTIYSCMMSVGTEFVSGIYRKNDRYECVKINSRGAIIVDFNMPRDERKDLFSLGYDEVSSYFKNLQILVDILKLYNS